MSEQEKLIAELREQVARIIDPLAWAGPRYLWEYIGTRDDAQASALTKAEAIHALYATALEGVMGERDALQAEFHRRGISIVGMTEWAGAHLCRAEAAEARAERAEAALEELGLFLGEVGGTCLGVAMSGSNHPAPDVPLMGLFEKSQALTEKVRAALSTLPAIVGGDNSSCTDLSAHVADATATDTQSSAGLCSDCPPVSYPTEATRCLPCPRRLDPDQVQP